MMTQIFSIISRSMTHLIIIFIQNKPIQSLHGQNGLPEYNRIGSPGDMFQNPDQKYGSQFVLQNSNTDNQD